MTRATKRPVSIVLWLFVIEGIVVLLLIPGHWMRDVIRTEHDWLWRGMGAESAAWVEHTALDWYTGAVIETGTLDATYNHLLPTPEQISHAHGMEHIGDHWFPLVESRLDALFATIYQVFVRLALLVSWLPFLTITAAPAILDGMMAWRIRQQSFAYTSPVVHRFAMQAAVWSCAVLVLILFVPFPISPTVFPILGVVLILALARIAANTQKRV